MLKFCYTVSQEITLIMAAIAVIAPIMHEVLNHNTRKKNYSVIVISFILCVVLIVNHSYMETFTMIPENIVNSTYKEATKALEEANLGWNLPTTDTTVSDAQIITGMDEQEGTIVPKHTTVHLHYDAANPEESGTVDDANGTSNATASSVPASSSIRNAGQESASSNVNSTVATEVGITIDSATVFQEGFHYEFPDPENAERTVLIDFNKGLFGTFHYSRALSSEEIASMGHGGSLYDENMNEISGGIYWSDTNGHFAMQFPENLSSGTYVYELYQVIDGQSSYSRVKFSF